MHPTLQGQPSKTDRTFALTVRARRIDVTCRDFADFLLEYLDGSLPESQRMRFEAHLEECPDCVAYLTTYQETIKLGKAVCADDQAVIPPEVPKELVQAILNAQSGGHLQG